MWPPVATATAVASARDALKDAEQQYESIIYVSNKSLDEFNAARDHRLAATAPTRRHRWSGTPPPLLLCFDGHPWVAAPSPFLATEKGTGKDGDRSCYVLTGCSTLPPAHSAYCELGDERERMLIVTNSSRCWFTEPIAANNRELESPLLLRRSATDENGRETLPELLAHRPPVTRHCPEAKHPHTLLRRSSSVVAEREGDGSFGSPLESSCRCYTPEEDGDAGGLHCSWPVVDLAREGDERWRGMRR
nr:hypothetical protein Iba_chr01bCG5470 [Ipomoea batatas]